MAIIKLLKNMLLSNKPLRAVKVSKPYKTVLYDKVADSDRLDRGEISDRAKNFIDAVRLDDLTVLHSAVIVENGVVVGEYYDEYLDSRAYHEAYSMSKTLVSLAIGVLIGEGKLRVDDKVCEILDLTSRGIKARGEYLNLTIKDLLTMKSMSSFNEFQAIPTSQDWLRDFYRAKKKKGEFDYNSLNSYVLSAVVQKISGVRLSQFLKVKVFEPLGIRRYFWEEEKGVDKGGWGLYALCEDMAKLGLLVLNKGKWRGEQLVPKSYIEEMTKAHSKAPSRLGDYDYGYHLWVHREENVLLFSGMLGQNVFIFPDKNVVVAINAGGGDIFQRYPVYDMAKRVFCDGEELKVVEREKDSGYSFEFDGEYKLAKPARKIGILPLTRSVMANNYRTGIDKISVQVKSGKFVIQGANIPIKVGEKTRFDLSWGGEIYACISGLEYLEGKALLVLSFPETAVRRFFEFDIKNQKIRIYETPILDILNSGVDMACEALGKGLKSRLLRKMYNSKFLRKRINRLVNFETKIINIK
ncbi:MAG: serine hydrolase [Clostridia bacterium]|nr:serine hydrolase [Clostridia bacterium]